MYEEPLFKISWSGDNEFSDENIQKLLHGEYEKPHLIFQKNKPNNKEYAYIQTKIKSVEAPLIVLASYILKGISFKCAFFNNDTFVEQQLFCIDIDNENDGNIMTIDDCKQIAHDNNLPISFAYFTFSHTDSKPKYRLIFLSDKVVTNENDVVLINKYLISLFPQSDNVCYNVNRLWAGTNNQNPPIMPCDELFFNHDETLKKAKELDEQNNIISAPTVKQYEPSQSIDFTDLITKIKENSVDYLASFRSKNSGYNCPCCPSGTGKNGTGMLLNPKSNHTHNYHCFSCGWNGDIIEYHSNIHNMTFIESVKSLCQMFNIYHDFTQHTQKCQQMSTSKPLNTSSSITTPPKQINTLPNPSPPPQSTAPTSINTPHNKINVLSLLKSIEFEPNNTIKFERDKCVEIVTGGGKTYNLTQICLNKLINGTGNKIIIVTATNDLINDFCESVCDEIKNLLPSDGAEHLSTDFILSECNILKMNLDLNETTSLSEYDIIVTNQSYLFPLGDTTQYSIKMVNLFDEIRQMNDIWDIYIDECHMMENYKYSVFDVGQLVANLNNKTTSKTKKIVKEYYNFDYETGDISVNQLSYKTMLHTDEIGIKRYKYSEYGLIDFKYLHSTFTKKSKKMIEKKPLFYNERIKLYRTTYMYNVHFDNNLLNDESMTDIQDLLMKSNDIFMIQNGILIEYVVDGKTYFINSHTKFLEWVMNESSIDSDKKNNILKSINMLNVVYNVLCFSTSLHIEKPLINMGLCHTFYTTATTDIIQHKYEIVKPKIQAVHEITNINVLFASLSLAHQLNGTGKLSVCNIDKINQNTLTVLLAEKRKILDTITKINKKQTELFNTSFHFESDTLIKIDDTHSNTINTINKITYLGETRQLGTNWDTTATILLDCKRSINANETYNRYIDYNGNLHIHHKNITTVTFEHMKQAIGRIMRGNIHNKTIVFCLPDRKKSDTDLTDFDFKLDEFITMIKDYFGINFSEISMNYHEMTTETNKTYVANHVAEFIGLTNATPTSAKNNRNHEIIDRYRNLLGQKITKGAIKKILAEEFQLSERQIERAIKEETKQVSDEVIIDCIVSHQQNKMKKTDIIKKVVEIYKIGERKVYNIYKQYNL